MTPRLRETIIRTPDSSPGLLVVDGQQKSFTLEGAWKSPVAPALNMAVDVEPGENLCAECRQKRSATGI